MDEIHHVSPQANDRTPRPAHVHNRGRIRRYAFLPLGSQGWNALVVFGAGGILGAFLSRMFAEIPSIEGPLYRPGPALAMTLSSGTVFLLAWTLFSRWHSRRPGTTATLPVAPLIPFYALLIYLPRPMPNLLQASVLLAGVLALVILLGRYRLRIAAEWPIVLVLFLVPLAAYLCTLAPGVGTRDGYELQAISATLGFAHPTGYPLFPLLGRLWIAVWPFGSMAWRINLLCALFAAASIPLVYGTARRILGHRSFAAWSALLFAFSHTLWTQASQPEKYTLNAFFVALVLYLAFGSTDPEHRSRHPYLPWLGLAYGLSLTHHRTMLMLAPALAAYLLWRDPRLLRRPREWVPALAIALAPLAIYFYIPWRAYAQGWAMSWSEFLRYIAGTHYGPAVRLLDWVTPERSQMFWRFLLAQFGYVGVGLGVLGLVGLGLERRWRFLVCTALAYMTYYVWGTGWYAYYNDVNSFIPNHMILVLWMGSGAVTLWKLISTWLVRWDKDNAAIATPEKALVQPDRAGMIRAGFWSCMALLPLGLIWTNAPQVDMSDRWGMTHWGEYVVALDIAPDATILADREKHPPLDYMARIERRRPDLDVVILGDEATYRQRLGEDLEQGKTVYLARFLPGMEGRYHLRSLGPLVEVSTTPLLQTEPLAGVATDWSVSQGTEAPIRLLGYDLEEPVQVQAGQPQRLTLFWQAAALVPGNYQVHLRLVSAAGNVWWTSGDHPVSGMYPTAAWKPGEIIPDWHEVSVSETLPPGTYTLEVGLFAPFSEQGLVTPEGKSWQPLETLTVAPASSPPKIPNRLRAIAPHRMQLLGYDLPTQVPPGGRATLKLYWQALGPLPNYEIGTRVNSSDEQGEWTFAGPNRGEYPTSSWPPGKTIVTTHLLTMPEQIGQAVVQIALRDPSGTHSEGTEGMLSFFPGWLARPTTVLSLPPLSIAGRPPTAPGAANWADRILLLEADPSPKTLSPGGPIQVVVTWQCMRAMDVDYTLFIHILGPDGTLKGQIDVMPKNGTHPTSQWREGETVEDSYLLYVDRDAPPGAYQLEIGWYLLETMQRLPVLDAEGRAIDDKLLLSGLMVARP